MTATQARSPFLHPAAHYLALPLTVGFLLFWHLRTSGHLSGPAILAACMLVALFLAYGRLALLALCRQPGLLPHPALQLLGGFFIFNTSLFLMALSLPFGIIADIAILAAIALAATGLTWRQRAPGLAAGDAGGASIGLPALLAIVVSGVAATLWCSDAQPSMVQSGATTVFQVWKDMFIHASEIKVFAQSHGFATIDDIKLAGSVTPVYHFASYVPAAAMSALADVPAVEAYSSVQLPFGIFLTGLAAFSLIAALFGGWAGLAACIAVLLLPDPYFQGVGSRYMSYQFISQTGPGMLYGVACAALGWLLLIEACRRGRLALVWLAYACLLMCMLYKAHLFVANAFLMMIYPCLFFKALAGKWRLLAAMVGVPVFVSVIMLSQRNPRVPVLRLDGSGIDPYLHSILGSFELHSMVGDFFGKAILLAEFPRPVQLGYVAAMILVCTFGLWLLAAAVAAYAGRTRISGAQWQFPVLVVVNYLVMSMGLALDAHGIGMPEEILQRPLVWAYFVLAACSAGAIYVLAAASRPRAGAALLAAMFVGGVVATSGAARNLQTIPSRADYATYGASTRMDTCLVQAAQYMRAHGPRNGIFVDPDGDASFALTALSEKRLYVGASRFGGKLPLQRERAAEVATLEKLHDAAAVKSFAQQRGIGWYLQHPRTALAWDASLAPAFECGAVRLYHFD